MKLKILAITTTLISLTLASCQTTANNIDPQLLNSVPSLRKPGSLKSCDQPATITLRKSLKIAAIVRNTVENNRISQD
ncbi:MAG: hypothetical protein U7123_15260 [Potamolinea sp.]